MRLGLADSEPLLSPVDGASMKRRPAVQWTPKMEARLRQMWRLDCLPIRDIADNLGIGANSVEHKAAQLRLCMHPSSGINRRPSDNLRVPRKVWGGSDFNFWRIKSDTEVSRA